MGQPVLIEKNVKAKSGIWLLTLNCPQSSNALSDEVIDGLLDALEQATLDETCHAVLLTGAGKSFCAGGDVKAMKSKSGMFAGESFELKKRYQRGIQRIPLCLEQFDKPLIALVNGAAIGAGCDLCCMADLRIASHSARFGETFARLGLVPGDGGAFFLSRIVGYTKAMEMFLTAELYSAESALQMGLVSKVTAPEDLLNEGIELALRITQNAPIALSLVKRALKEVRTQSIQSHLDMISTYQGIAQRTSDHFEGVDALIEKRSPKFTGK